MPSIGVVFGEVGTSKGPGNRRGKREDGGTPVYKVFVTLRNPNSWLLLSSLCSPSLNRLWTHEIQSAQPRGQQGPGS